MKILKYLLFFIPIFFLACGGICSMEVGGIVKLKIINEEKKHLNQKMLYVLKCFQLGSIVTKSL